jgi:hypothetical protein
VLACVFVFVLVYFSEPDSIYLSFAPSLPSLQEAKVEAITTAEEAREAERAKLQQELKEAQDAGDFEKMEALQSQIDVFDEVRFEIDYITCIYTISCTTSSRNISIQSRS